MQLALLMSALTAVSAFQSPPIDDPVALEVGFRQLRRSEIAEAAREAKGPKAQLDALRTLLNRVLLLQEARQSGLVPNLPTEPAARAEAFLNNVVSERVVCGRLKERDLQLMYQAMRPRFVHGHLYRLAELTLHCWDPSFGCALPLTAWAETHWGPLVEILTAADELHLLWLSVKHPPGVIRFQQYTLHVSESGESSAPRELTEALQRLGPGEAAFITTPGTIRVPLLIEYEAPAAKGLDDHQVRAEVLAELCPRVVRQNREAYLEGLRRSAYLKLHRTAWPDGVVLPEYQR